MQHRTPGVYVQTNDAAANQVAAFGRNADGTLEPLGAFPTGGAGDGRPHLTSQGSVVLTDDGSHLLVTNAASDDVSLLSVSRAGLELVDRIATGGTAPKSVAEHGGLVYVLNTGGSCLTGFRIADGRLSPLDGSRRRLSAPDADGAQVSFTPDGTILVVTERGTDAIVTYAVGPDGLLGESQVHPSSGLTPYGFAFTSDGTLVVTEAFGAQAGKAAASSYRIDGGSVRAPHPVGRQRAERDLLGRRDEGRPLRVHHELRGREDLPLPDRGRRLARPRGPGGGGHGRGLGRRARRGPDRGRKVPLRGRRRRPPGLRLRRGAGRRARRRLGRGRACRRRWPGWLLRNGLAAS